MVSLTIDGKRVEVEAGTTVLAAAEKLGIRIPTLCHHKALAPYGACRLCLVELEGPRPVLQASCIYPAQQDLVVQTASERVLRTRRMMLELLLARCSEIEPIQALAREMGVEETRFPQQQEDCILCGLCVRACEEISKRHAISFAHRGGKRAIQTPFLEMAEVCVGCKACSFVCPTGVIEIDEAD